MKSQCQNCYCNIYPFIEKTIVDTGLCEKCEVAYFEDDKNLEVLLSLDDCMSSIYLIDNNFKIIFANFKAQYVYSSSGTGLTGKTIQYALNCNYFSGDCNNPKCNSASKHTCVIHDIIKTCQESGHSLYQVPCKFDFKRHKNPVQEPFYLTSQKLGPYTLLKVDWVKYTFDLPLWRLEITMNNDLNEIPA